MRNSLLVLGLLLLVYLPLAIGYKTSLPNSLVEKQPKVNKEKVYFQLPLAFEKNQGQADKQVSFLTHTKNQSVFFTPKEVVISIKENQITNSKEVEQDVLRMQLVGAKEINPIALEPIAAKVNYLVGNTPENWQKNVSCYSKIKYKNVYPNIDMLYYGNQNTLEYDLILNPGGKLKDIKLYFQGAHDLNLDQQGNLVISLTQSKIYKHKPVVYQEINGHKELVECSYIIGKNNQVQFEVPSYDTNNTLVIDPVLTFSTYFGGTFTDEALAITTDFSDNIYIAGTAGFTDFPIIGNINQQKSGTAFLLKLDSNNNLLYSTYFGGSGIDTITSLASDKLGNIYLTGETFSDDFPIVNAFQSKSNKGSDAFISKISPDGSQILYSSYLGGNGNDIGNSITLDSLGNIYIVGSTFSNDFPLLNALQPNFTSKRNTRDGFITKLNALGNSLVYSTYLGGDDDDVARKIVVDSNGNAYVTGFTSSTNFPATALLAGTQVQQKDIFLTKINPEASKFVYSVYFGGSEDDEANSLVIDSLGNVYLTGITKSANFPLNKAIQANYNGNQDGFITKLNQQGNSISFSTFLGGQGFDEINDIIMDKDKNIYLAGSTTSSDFPVLNAFQSILQAQNSDSSQDSFVTKINTDTNSVVFSTYFGGDDNDKANAIGLNSKGDIYLAGKTKSKNLPLIRPLQRTIKSSFEDIFIARISDITCNNLSVNPTKLPDATENTLYQQTISTSGGVSPFEFRMLSGFIPTGIVLSSNGTLSGTTKLTGEFSFVVLVTDVNGCSGSQIFTLTVNESRPDYDVNVSPSTGSVIAGQSANFTVSIDPKNGFNKPVELDIYTFPSVSNLQIKSSKRQLTPDDTLTITVNTFPETNPKNFFVLVSGQNSKPNKIIQFDIISPKSEPDYQISLDSVVEGFGRNATASFNINSKALGNFNKPINLIAGGFTANGFALNTVLQSKKINPGESTKLTVSGDSLDPFGRIIVHASTGDFDDPKEINHLATALVYFSNGGIGRDFLLSVKSDFQRINAGDSAIYDLDVKGSNGFNQPINLTATIAPFDENINVVVSPNIIMPNQTAKVMVTTSDKVPAKNFNLYINGVAGQTKRAIITRLATVTPDFSLFTDGKEIDLLSRKSAKFDLNVNKIGGFNDKITLTPDFNMEAELKIKITPKSQIVDKNTNKVTFKITKTKDTPGTFSSIRFVGKDSQGRTRTVPITIFIP